jgi:energy-coupling factor transporter transmembrane protein EcfT
MPIQNYSTRITLLTVISSIIGFATVAIHPFFAIAQIFVFALPIFKKRLIAWQNWIQISKYTTTTFIFGIINGYTTNRLRDYLYYTWWGQG